MEPELKSRYAVPAYYTEVTLGNRKRRYRIIHTRGGAGGLRTLIATRMRTSATPKIARSTIAEVWDDVVVEPPTFNWMVLFGVWEGSATYVPMF